MNACANWVKFGLVQYFNSSFVSQHYEKNLLKEPSFHAVLVYPCFPYSALILMNADQNAVATLFNPGNSTFIIKKHPSSTASLIHPSYGYGRLSFTGSHLIT